MKKVLSMILAMATVASMASVAFATYHPATKEEGIAFADSTEFMKEDSDGLVTEKITGKVAKGTKMYIEVSRHADITNKDMKKFKVKSEWLVGESLLEVNPELVYKKSTPTYKWYVQVTTKESFDTKSADLLGDITLYRNSPKKATVNQIAHIEYGSFGAVTKAYPSEISTLTMADTAIIKFDNKGNYNDAEEAIEFEGVGTFEVDVYEQGSLYLGWDVKYNAEVGDLYPEANLEFVNFKGAPKFNKRGVMRLFSTEGKFLYAIEDGKLAKVEATYDADDEAFKFGTKQLGTFIISDVELDVATFNNAVEKDEEVVEAPVVDKENPDTGR